jgi:hypothetical protein
MANAENLQHRATQLLWLAQKARADNYIDLAEYIVERATQLFDEAIILEQSSKSATPSMKTRGTNR